MGRDQRPPFTGRGVRRGILPLALSFAVLLAGCGGDSYTRFSSGGIPPAGVSTTGSTVYVQTSGSGSAFGTLLAALILATQSYLSDLEQRQAGMSYWPNSYMASGRAVPELDVSRRVVEQDCTKPIVDWSANLKCK